MSGGCDPTQIAGISPLSFMKLVSEVGTDLDAWKTEKRFTSWLGLAPGKHESGKRRRRAPRPKTAAGQIFRECVPSIAKSKYTALGAFYRRLKARKGPAVAATAVARKLAEHYYRAMSKGMDYVERGVAHYEEAYRKQSVRYLKKNGRHLRSHRLRNPCRNHRMTALVRWQRSEESHELHRAWLAGSFAALRMTRHKVCNAGGQ